LVGRDSILVRLISLLANSDKIFTNEPGACLTEKMMDVPSTSTEILIKIRKAAIDAGFRYVYTGNVPDKEGSTTFCPKCKKPLIVREGFSVVENKLVNGKCPECGESIAGIWE